jgi:glycosyltransferase involved in cell wall biosynthesis
MLCRMESDNRLRVMHFAHIINRYDFIDNVVRNVAAERFEASAATFVSETNIAAPRFAADGIPHHVLGARSRRDYPVVAARLARLLRERRIDVLHAHHFDPGAIAWAATRLHPSTRLVIGRHYSDDHHAYLTGLKRHGYLGAERIVHSGAARIVAPSRMIRDLLVERQGVPADKVAVIPYPFDPARYRLPAAEELRRLRAELGIENRFVIATVARILPKKGHSYLLAALRELAGELPRLVWVVLGDGPQRAELESEVGAAGLSDRVRFTGWRTDALAVIAAADAIVQPTLQEAYSQVMVEAQWMGTPLVMTDVSGVGDLVIGEETGIVVPRRDPRALAIAVRRLYEDRELGGRLAAAARARVADELPIPRVIPRYEAVYAALTAD